MPVSSTVATVTPFHDSSRRRRLVKIGCWLVGLLALAVILRLLGVDVIGWLQDVWTQIKAVPLQLSAAGVCCRSPDDLERASPTTGSSATPIRRRVQLWPIVTAYAVGVGMNSFLPANIGTFVTLLMFLAVIPGSTFPGIFAAYVVNKIFFTVVGGSSTLYSSSGGRGLRRRARLVPPPRLLALLIIAGGVFLVFLLGRIFWHWLKSSGRRQSRAARSSATRRRTSPGSSLPSFAATRRSSA